MKNFYILECCINLNIYYQDHLRIAFEQINLLGMSRSFYVRIKVFQSHNLCGGLIFLKFILILKDHEGAKEIFEKIREQNPYFLDGIDLYSNILFSQVI